MCLLHAHGPGLHQLDRDLLSRSLFVLVVVVVRLVDELCKLRVLIFHEVGRRIDLHGSSGLHHDDAIEVQHSRDAMGDDDQRRWQCAREGLYVPVRVVID